MMPLYFYLMIGSLTVPMLFSIFKIDFIKHWKNFTISTVIVATVFLIWDAIFTANGVWGFNHDYCLGLFIFGMPIEEFSFFLIIPFTSLFTHFAILYVFPKLKVAKRLTEAVLILTILLSIVLIIKNPTSDYTVVNYLFLIGTILIGWWKNFNLLQQFMIPFLVILIPFFAVNGVLTGIATETPVVWYDNAENSGIRLTTIPIEDIGYAFTMLFGNLLIFESLNKKDNK
jgi:lycopene cyclase domain-containing protein